MRGREPSPLSARLTTYGDVVGAFVAQSGPVDLLTSMPGNVGDQLIARGTERLLASRGVSFARVSVHELGQGVGSALGRTLVVPGSGAWSALWHEWLPQLVLTASGMFDRVVVLPSGYDRGAPGVVEALSRPNVFAFAREADSYAHIKHLGRAALALDPALYAFDLASADVDDGLDWRGDRVLVALRTDAGSLLPRDGWRPVDGRSVDISVTSPHLDDFLGSIRAADGVVTDRLHVAVGSIMLGKRVRFLETYGRKLSTHLGFTFRDQYGSQVQERDRDWFAAHGFIEPSGRV